MAFALSVVRMRTWSPAPRTHELIDFALGDELALREDGDGVAYHLDLVEQVARQEHGAATGGEASDQIADLSHAGGVHAVGRFVEEQQFGIAEQGVRQAKSLLHAEGVVAETVVCAVCEVDPGE